MYRNREKHVRLLLGSRYILLRREFGFWRTRTFEIAPRARRVLITMFRRSVKRLGKDGPVTLRHARSWNDIGLLLPTFAVAHVARFLATGRLSNLVRAERRRFLEKLAEALSLSGWVTLDQLLVGDRAAAWNYGFQFRGSWFWYQPTFDSKMEALSPGYCLLTMIIGEACDINEMRVVDLGLGAEGYKERFSNGTRATLHAGLGVGRLLGPSAIL